MLKAWRENVDLATWARRVNRQYVPLALAVTGASFAAYGLASLVALKLGWKFGSAAEPRVALFGGVALNFLGSFLRHFHRINGRLNWLTHQAVWAAGVIQANGLHAERDQEGGGTASGSAHRWPWGAHHTEGLGHLEAAAKKWWTHYDPKEPDTAPTNEMVADWLVEERNVSKDKAKAIASLLRADGLRTGPRR